ncbi:methyltransferase domain-containing protein [Pseudoduganella namucuonensis]|uniref:Spermidine synthase n=1 Tax=Pseudoduganella namucuonensis TaxID=1035707 RepID=A0A1I7LWR9_9BURK|nr:methyltransferase domain-containing protein [Pseudoduganella namucuonensis]SFV14166.1 spermidine synthase [Pseudoduganella namucuonensis]
MDTALQNRPATPLVRTRGGLRTLEFEPGMVQSEMSVADPRRLVLGYARAMMCFTLFHPRPAHIVMVGLGGGSLAKFCYHYLPGCRITVLELRADVIALREQFAIPADDERFRIVHTDAALHMPLLRNSADVVLVDGFDHQGLPPELGTTRFYADCRRALRPGGVLAANIFSYDPRYAAMLRRLRQCYARRVGQFHGIAGNNRIVFALKEPGEPGALRRLQRAARRRGPFWGLVHRLMARWVVFRLRWGQRG